MLRSLLFPSVLFLACLSAGAASTSLPEGDGQAESVVRHPQVGVCTHLRKWDNEEIIGHLARSGVTWIRDDFFWKSIEKEKGVYQLPESYSKWLDLAHRAGLKVVAIFNGSNPLYAPDIYDPKAFSKAAAEFARLTRGKVTSSRSSTNRQISASASTTAANGTEWRAMDPRVPGSKSMLTF